MQTKHLDDPITDIGLSARTSGLLQRSGIRLVRELVQRTDADLLKTNGINRTRWAEIKQAVTKLELSLGMRLPSGETPPPRPVSEVALGLLAGDLETIDALARGDTAAWQSWLEHLVSTPPFPAPTAAVERMLEREPSPSRWLEIASRVLFDIRSEVFTTSLTARRPLLSWLGDGIVAARGPLAPASLEVRMETAVRTPSDVEDVRRILADVRAASATHQLLASALVLYGRRLAEADEHSIALETFAEAETTLDDDHAAVARRLRAACLLRLHRLDEAFAILDSELLTPAPALKWGASIFAPKPAERFDEALWEAAQLSAWTTVMKPEWIRALGAIASRAPGKMKADLWRRFERALVTMVDSSKNPGSDLEVVIRQATQRRLRKVAEAASELATRRGIELVDNPYFGSR